VDSILDHSSGADVVARIIPVSSAVRQSMFPLGDKRLPAAPRARARGKMKLERDKNTEIDLLLQSQRAVPRQRKDQVPQ
jgi:hypothetical protein